MTPSPLLYVVGQLGAGGTERQLLELIRRLDRGVWEPHLATFTRGGALETDFAEVCETHLLPKSPLSEPKTLFELSRLIRRLKPAIVHTSLFPANWRGALASIPARPRALVGSVRNMGDWMGPWRLRMERAAFRRCDAVIVNASAVGRFVTETLRVPEAKVRVIVNGVDVDTFRPRVAGEPDLRASFGCGEKSILIGAVMSLTAKKNPFLLVEAASKVAKAVPEARFLLAGEGPLREAVERRIETSGLSARFRLAGLRRDIPALLRSLDLLALPSDREGLPNVVLEAMATGLPVVATDAGGTTELVEDGVTGRLVGVGDAEAFASALAGLAADPQAIGRFGSEALRRARDSYAMPRMVASTVALYEELLTGGAPERSRLRSEAASSGGRTP